MKLDSRTAIEAITSHVAQQRGLNPADIVVHVSKTPTHADWDALDRNSYETTCARCGSVVIGQFGPNKETDTPCGECGSTEYSGGFSSPAGAMSLALREGF